MSTEQNIHGPMRLALPGQMPTVMAETFRSGDGAELLFWVGPCDDQLVVDEVPGTTVRWNGRDYQAVSCARLPRVPDYQTTPCRMTLTAIREL